MSGRQRVRTTLRQVAQHAGVSAGTASAVFSGNAGVSGLAREAVLQAANELGYQPRSPNPASRIGPGVRSIGVVVPAARTGPPAISMYSAVVDGIQRACARLRLTLTYEALNDPADRPLVLEHRQTGGLLLLGQVERTAVEALVDGMPTVLVDHAVRFPGVDCVRADDEAGGYLATKHLLDLGHRDPVPAVIAGPPHIPSMADRLRGYCRALVDAGYRVDPSLIRHAALDPDSGNEQMTALLGLPRRPTAVFCCTDVVAPGVLAALRRSGVEVPTQCSVIGYDDMVLAAHTSPPLTTVGVDRTLLGVQGVWHLVQRIRNPRMARRETRIEASLVERASTAPRP